MSPNFLLPMISCKELSITDIHDAQNLCLVSLIHNTAIVADSEKSWRLVSEFGRECNRRKLKVNVE